MHLVPPLTDPSDVKQEQEQSVDVAREPVDLNDDAAFMDTGVLHEERICIECGDDLATQGYAMCSDCLERTDGRA
jgi:hypothetical protein